MRIHILALVLFIQCCVSCQQAQEKALSAAAKALFNPVAAGLDSPSKQTRATTPNIVFQSDDDGQTWYDISMGLPEKVGVSRVFADQTNVFLIADGGLYRNVAPPNAQTWEKEFFVSEPFSDIFPGRGGLYASSYGKGFYQKVMGTDVWKPMHKALKDKRVRTIYEAVDGAIFVGCESGIYKSTNGGDSWKHVYAEEGINSFAASGDALICGSYRGLLRSTDGGEHWDCVLAGGGSAYGTKPIQGGLIAIMDGRQPGQNFADVFSGRLLTSTDGGKTWQRLEMGLPLNRDIHDIEQVGQSLFCSTDEGISRSADGGKTWQLVRPADDKNEMVQLVVLGQVIYAVRVTGC